MPGTRFIFSDRPVGLRGDVLWKDDTIKEQIQQVAKTIVAPLDGLEPKESITFAVHGRWGTGKSSALRMIREQCQELTGDQVSKLVFCDYAAPAFESLPYDAKTTLILRMIVSLSGGMGQAVEEFLQEALPSNPEVLPPGRPTGEVGWAAHALDRVVATLTRLTSLDAVLAKYLVTRDHTEHEKTLRVMTVMLDDLDRCQPAFVWQVLESIQQLSVLPNVYFVLAIDQQQLVNVIESRLGNGEAPVSADFALEKYVQHSIWVPDMNEARLENLLRAIAGEATQGDLALQALADNQSFLQHGLRVLTPRSIKRCINTIRLDLEKRLSADLTEIEQKLVVKEKVLGYAWPDFYRNYWVRAHAGSGRDRRVFEALEAAGLAFRRESDNARLEFETKRIANAYGIDASGFSESLLTYLGLPPFWFISNDNQEKNKSDYSTVYSVISGLVRPVETPVEPEVIGDSKEAIEHFDELYIRCEAAEARKDREETLGLAEEMLHFVIRYRSLFGHEQASSVGNTAINAEAFGAKKLASDLYHLALDLDPEHSNNIQNFVDFVVKTRMAEHFQEADSLVAKLKRGKHALHRPDRTLTLEVQLKTLMGQSSEINPETVQRMVAEFHNNPTDLRHFAELMSLFGELEDYASAEEIARAHYVASPEPLNKYAAVRALADTLARSSEAQNELLALDIYRFLLASPRFVTAAFAETIPDCQHNYATLLYRQDYDHEAGLIWFEAYRANPTSRNLRSSYSQYLLRARRPDAAAAVMDGQPIAEPVTIASSKTMPARFLPGQRDWWWEQE